jgi:ATP-dependent Clp protease protease subunit
LVDEDDLLQKMRMIVLRHPIDDDVAQLVIAKMLFLEAEAPDQPLTLLVNCPGGSIPAGMAIHDTISSIRPPVRTHCYDRAGSFAAILMAHGRKGLRTAHPGARFSLSNVWPARGADVSKDELVRSQSLLIDVLSRDVNRTRDEIGYDMWAHASFSAEEAISYGLIDAVVDNDALLGQPR